MSGTGFVLAAASKSSGSSATSYLLILVLIVVMMLVFFRSNRRRQQNAQNTQRQVVNGARVRTVHGIYGTVRSSDDQNVMVEVVAEPFLVRAGLVARTPRGRVATPAAWQHLGLAVPERTVWGSGAQDGATTLFDQ